MSHQYYNPARTRLQRSELAVPGSSPKMFEKALNSNADYIFFSSKKNYFILLIFFSSSKYEPSIL